MMTPSRWNTAPSAITCASVRLVTLTTTYLPRISDPGMAGLSPARSLDAGVEHLDQLLLLEGARHLLAEPPDEVGAVALELPADDAAGPGHVDGHAVQHPARPRGEHDHPVGQVDGLVDVMGDEDHGAPGALPDIEQERLHLVAGLDVEGGEGLVHQQDVGAHAEGAGDGHPLLHAARQLVGMLAREVQQSDEA